jgi:hypothetical protein
MYSSRPRKLRRKDLDENEKRVNILFLEMDSPRPAGEGIRKGFLEKDDGKFIYLFLSFVLVKDDFNRYFLIKIYNNNINNNPFLVFILQLVTTLAGKK